MLHRKIADKVANHGYFVVVPDFFHGEPYNAENASRPLNSWLKDHNSVSSYLLLYQEIFVSVLQNSMFGPN